MAYVRIARFSAVFCASVALVSACRKEVAHVDLGEPATTTHAPTPVRALSVAAPAGPLFPEDPALDDLKPADVSFAQETFSDSLQHCREWGVQPSRQAELTDSVNAKLAPRGVHLPDKARAKGIVVAIGSVDVGLVTHQQLVKLVVCTEGVASRSAVDAFKSRLLRDPRVPQKLGPPDLAWERIHTSGEVEVGFRWTHADSEAAGDVINASKRDEHTTAKLRGSDLWWSAVLPRR